MGLDDASPDDNAPMQTFSLGPLVLPLAPLVVLATLWLAAALARRWGGGAADSAVWQAAVAGVLAARAVWLMTHAQAYAQQPLAWLDVRDGGWLAPAGWLVAGLWLAWHAWRVPALRAGLGAAVLTGAVGAGAVGVLATSGPEVTAVPAVTLAPLQGGPAQPLPALVAGRPAVVNLWATWCGPCRAELPALAAARAAHPQVVFVLANQRESVAEVRAYLAQQALPADAVWLDAQGALAQALGARGLPTTLFFDASGRLVDAHVGVLSTAALRARLTQLSLNPAVDRLSPL